MNISLIIYTELLYLEYDEIIKLETVSKSYRNIIIKDYLWKSLFKRDYPFLNITVKNRNNYKRIYSYVIKENYKYDLPYNKNNNINIFNPLPTLYMIERILEDFDRYENDVELFKFNNNDYNLIFDDIFMKSKESVKEIKSLLKNNKDIIMIGTKITIKSSKLLSSYNFFNLDINLFKQELSDLIKEAYDYKNIYSITLIAKFKLVIEYIFKLKLKYNKNDN